jgi:hypothetical protein
MVQFFFFSIYVLNFGEAPQTTRHLSTSKTKAIPSEVIVISDDDDSPPPSISQAKSKKMPIEVIEIFDEPNEVIEIFDSDDEQLPSKAQLEKNVGRSSSDRLQECATESSPRRDQSRHSSLGGDSFEGSGGNADVMNIDGGDLSPSSPRALSQELQVTDDANDNKGNQSFIPLPSSSPSSVGLSPKDNYLSTPPAPTSSITSVTISPPRQQTFPLPTRPNSVKKPITADPSMAGSSSNRLGFSSVAISSSLQAPPPADKHRRQFARKFAIRSMSNEDEDIGESSSEPEGTVNTKANKGKEKEIRESSSSSGTESINMRGLRDALAVDSVMLKQRPVSPTLPKKQGQTLAEAIVSAGQLNRTKKMRPRRLQRSTKDTPVDLASDVEAGDKDGPVDENEKALKAAIGSSRLLVNLLPALKEKSSVSATAAAAKGNYMIFIFTSTLKIFSD